MKKISVVGAGFAGMTLSLRLAEKGFQVDLYEKSSRVGGLLGTEITPYGLAEKAANALIRTERAEKLFAELGVAPQLTREDSKRRFIFRGSPRRWPLSFFESLAFLFRFLPVAVFKRENLKPHPEQTLKSWGLHHLGEAPTQFLLEPAMQGIYASEISSLSASLILGPLFSKNREKYKGLLTGKNGLQDLLNALEKRLIEKGVRIHLNFNGTLEEVPGPVVLATSASAAQKITADLYPDVSSWLAKIHMSSVLSVKLFFDKTQESYKGFGCLVPQSLGFKTLGILMNSYIFAERDQTYTETWIMGGKDVAALLQKSDQEILDVILSERQQLLQRSDQIVHASIDRWDRALPCYDVQLEKVLHTITTPSHLYLHGNYLGGLGLSKILERSDRLAEELAKNYV